MDGKAWLGDIRKLYRDSKEACERAAAQVGDEDYFRAVGGNPTSIAILLKHVGGNHRSRWRDFSDQRRREGRPQPRDRVSPQKERLAPR